MHARLNQAQPYALGLFRIVIGLFFTCHGAASLFGVLGGMNGGSIPMRHLARLVRRGHPVRRRHPGDGRTRHPGRRPDLLRLHGVRVLQGPPARGTVPAAERRRALGRLLLGVPAAGLHRTRRTGPGPAVRPGRRRSTTRTARPSRHRPSRSDPQDRSSRTSGRTRGRTRGRTSGRTPGGTSGPAPGTEASHFRVYVRFPTSSVFVDHRMNVRRTLYS